jgi:hypothetical protein
MRGAERRAAPHQCRPFRVRLPALAGDGAPWRRALRLPALHRGVLTPAPGRAFGFPSLPPPCRAHVPRKDRTGGMAGSGTSRPSASSWQGAVVPPGGAPAPPGSMLAKHARGRRTGRVRELPGAGHRNEAPLPMPAPVRPALRRLAKTPLWWTRFPEYSPIGINVKGRRK